MISKVEIGLLGDDYAHNRYTLKAFTNDCAFIPLKVYSDGRIMYFRATYDFDDPYEEHEVDIELADEIRPLIPKTK